MWLEKSNMSIKIFLKKHYLALIFAVIVGMVSVLPQFLAIKAIGSDYKGIHFMYTANEDAYMARIQEIIDGHWSVSSAFFYEYKNWKTIMPPTGEYFYALPAILLRVSLSNVLVATKFLFPAILFLLIYFLLLNLGDGLGALSGKVNAVVGGLFVTLGYDLIDYKTAWQFLIGQRETTNLLLWTRPVNPVTGALLIFVFLLLLWKIVNNGRRWLVLPTGLVWGLMTGYFFSWSLSLAITAVLLAVFILRKKYSVVKNLLLVCLVFFLTSLPYWLNIFSSFGSVEGREHATRSGMLFTHTPIVNKVVLMITIIFLLASALEYFYTKKLKKENWWWFCLALIAAGWLAYNQQVITGRTVWYYHFVQYTIPLAVVVGMVLFDHYIKPRFFKIWLTGICLLAIAITIFNIAAIKSYAVNYESFKELQKYSAPFLWLNENTAKDCVVLTPQVDTGLDILIPAFTHCNVYVTSWVFDGVPTDRVWHNFLVLLRMKNVDPAHVKEYLENHEPTVRGQFFTDWGQLFDRRPSPYIQKKIDELAMAYQDFVKRDFVGELKRYKLDYLLFVGPPSTSTLKSLPDIKPVYNDIDFYIYQFAY